MNLVFRICGWASAAALGLLALVILIEISMRTTVGHTWQLSPEFAGYMLVATTFLGMCGVYRSGQLMRIEVFYDEWPPHVRRVLSVIFEFVSLVATAIATWYAWQFALNSFLRGTKAPTLYSTPLWIPQMLLPLGLALLTIAIALRLWSTLRQGSDA